MVEVAVRQLSLPDGFEMVYRDAGHSSGVPLMILHGLGSNHVQFEGDVAHFADTRRVIQPDLRGHGDTGSPPDAGVADYTCRKLAEDIAWLLDRLEVDRVDLIGNSLGGNVALELIDLRPGLVRSLVTFGTTYQLKVPKAVLLLRDVIYFVLGKRVAKWAAERTSKTPHGREILTRTFSLMRPETSRLVGSNICRFDYRPVAERFDGAILLLQCRDDRDINAVLGPTLETLSGLENAKIEQFETGGHCANVDDPVAFRERIDHFLAALDGQQDLFPDES